MTSILPTDSATLDDIFSSLLDGSMLSSRSSNKFEELATVLADCLRCAAEEIGIKALGHVKNVGNRISEATRKPLRYLFLIASEDVGVTDVERALRARALRLPTTILVHEIDGRWKATAVLAASKPSEAVAPSIPVVVLEAPPARPLPSEEATASVCRWIRGHHGASTFPDLAGKPAGSSAVALVVKSVSRSGNIGNRIAEGLGQRPDVIVVVVPDPLVDLSRGALRDQLLTTPATRAYLTWKLDDRVQVEEVRPATPNVRLYEHPHAETPRSAVREGLVNDHLENSSLEYRTLERVKQLRRHLPLDAGADRLYEEHQVGDDRLAYETRSLEHLRRLLLESDAPVTVILTGNAGHGKTHMCRRVLETASTDDVMERLGNDPYGNDRWELTGATHPIRVIKDLSEINPPDRAAERLEQMLEDNDAHVIVCANEGRLRDVVGRRPARLAPLLEALSHGLERGETSPEGRDDVHVINLNYQASCTADGGFLRHVLDHFLNFEGAWKVCTRCAAQSQCPIKKNRDLLSISPSAPESNATHRDALQELVRVAEEAGYVLTFRETLVFVAYIVTAGLSCKDVERLHRRGVSGNLEQYEVLRLLFERKLTDDESDVLKLLARLRRLDPGRVALRPTDERLHVELEESGALGTFIFGDESRQLYKPAELKEETKTHKRRLRRARRAAWLKSVDGDDEILRANRLGLRHYAAFKTIQSNPDATSLLSIIRSLVSGLHTIQGAVGVDSKSSLHLVDPAFGRSGSHSAIIARSLRVRDLDLWTESQWWRHLSKSGTAPILEAVEWLDRKVVLTHRKTNRVVLELDLLSFEFVMNAGNGVVMKDFNSAERRRILRTLARLAEEGEAGAEDEIRVLLDRGEGSLTVERDGTIMLERTA